MGTWRVGTFNIRTSRGLDGRNLWWIRRAATMAAIDALDVDVIALQEVRLGQLRYLREHLPEFALISVGRDDGRNAGEHLVIGVRRTRGRSEFNASARWFGGTSEVPSRLPGARRARMVLVTSGLPFVVMNTHLDESSASARARSIELLAAWAVDGAVVIGDLNCDIDDPVLQPLWDRGFVDALAPLPARGPGCATHHGFSGRVDGSRIDHVLVGPALRPSGGSIVQLRPGGRLPSDHWPVVATIDVE